MKLPTLDQTVNRPGLTSEVGAVRANPNAIIDTSASRTFAYASDRLFDIAEQRQAAAKRAQEQSDAVAAQKVVTQTNFEWAKRLQEAQEQAPEGAAGFGDQMLKAYEDDIEARLAQVPESARPWAQGQFDSMRGEYGMKAIGFEHQAGQAKQLTDLGDIADLNANGVRGDFGQFDQAMARTVGAIEASGLSAENKSKAKATAQETISIAALQGEIERNPAHAKQMLAAGGFDKALSPKNKDALLGSADLEIKRRQDDAERKKRLAAEDLRVAQADLREEARFQLAAIESGTVPAGYDDTIKRLQALGDNKTATTLQLARGNVQWVNDAKKMPPADLQAEIDRIKAEIKQQPDAVLAANAATRLQAGEQILDAKTKEEVAEIRADAQDAITAIAGGTVPAGLDGLIARAEAAGDAGTAQVLRQSRVSRAQAVELTKLSPAALNQRLDSMRGEIAQTGDMQWAATLAHRVETGEKIQEAQAKALREDALTWAEQTKVVPQTDLFGALATAAQTGDPSGLPAAIQARQRANAATAEKFGVQPELLKPAEAKAYVAAFVAAPNADAKAALIDTVATLPADQAGQIADQLMREKGGEDVGRILGAALDDPEAARMIIAGQEAKANVKGVKPEDGAALREAISGALGNLLPANPKARGAIEQNALDIYAQLSFAAGDNTGALDPQRMQTALDRASGGVIAYRDQSILPPKPGMTEAAFGDLIDKIDTPFLKAQIGASRTGSAINPVYRNGVSLTAEDLRLRASFQSAGSGTYFVLIDGEPVRDAATGRPFEIDFNGLLAGGAP